MLSLYMPNIDSGRWYGEKYPQGSLLGPLLFLVYVDGVLNLPVTEGSQQILYTDDIFLYEQLYAKKATPHYNIILMPLAYRYPIIICNSTHLFVDMCSFSIKYINCPSIFIISNCQLEEVVWLISLPRSGIYT